VKIVHAWLRELVDVPTDVETVASQLAGEAQGQAVLVRGFDDTHEGMLHNAAVANVVNDTLALEFSATRRLGEMLRAPLGGHCRPASNTSSGVTSLAIHDTDETADIAVYSELGGAD